MIQKFHHRSAHFFGIVLGMAMVATATLYVLNLLIQRYVEFLGHLLRSLSGLVGGCSQLLTGIS